MTSQENKITARQSNMELLRIISMMMVLIVHIDGASLELPYINGNISQLNAHNAWKLIVESFSIIGVNCFVLISGYFGIRPSWHGFLKFTGYCMFYSVGIYALAGLYIHFSGNFADKWSWIGLIESFLVYTHTDLWFVPAYLGLYLISPFINKAIDILDKHQFTIFLISFIAFNVYAGWLWDGSFNPTGYTIIQLIMLYLIGQYIKRYYSQINNNRKYVIAGYIIFTALIFNQSLYCTPTISFAYNSPFVLAASICFFLIFQTFKFHNNYINILATSAFSVYLIPKNPLIWMHLKKLVFSLWAQYDLTSFSFIAILLAIAIFFGCCIIDQIRQIFIIFMHKLAQKFVYEKKA